MKFKTEFGYDNLNPSNRARIEMIKNNIQSITPDDSYTIINLNFTGEEKKYLEELKIFQSVDSRHHTYKRYGNIGLMLDELPIYFQELGIKDKKIINILSNLVSRITCDFLNAVKRSSAWIAIRANKPNNDFDIPRWHMDGRYFRKSSGPGLKLVTTLKGPSTLLSDSKQKNIREKIQDAYREFPTRDIYSKLKKAIMEKNKEEVKTLQNYLEDQSLKSRKKIVSFLDENSIHSIENGEAVIYFVNDNKKGCIHSEPPINQDRIFVSILPGTVEEINELKKFRNI